MSRRARGWLAWLGELAQAVRDDPMLITPAVLVAVAMAAMAYALWSRL